MRSSPKTNDTNFQNNENLMSRESDFIVREKTATRMIKHSDERGALFLEDEQ